jgi:hypothetical protein
MILKVEKVLKQRHKRGQREFLVKYVGWPAKFNSWVKESDMRKI